LIDALTSKRKVLFFFFFWGASSCCPRRRGRGGVRGGVGEVFGVGLGPFVPEEVVHAVFEALEAFGVPEVAVRWGAVVREDDEVVGPREVLQPAGRIAG